MNAPMMVDATLQESQKAFYGSGFVAFAAFLGVVSILSYLGILYMTMVVAPNVTQRFSGALRERNVRSFFVGLPVTGSFLLLTALFQQAPILMAVTVLLGGVISVLGLAAASEDIGRRLHWACGKEGTRASHLASGWLVFAFASCVPVLGWFVIFPYVFFSGVGSVVVGAFSRRGPAAPDPKDIEFAKD